VLLSLHNEFFNQVTVVIKAAAIAATTATVVVVVVVVIIIIIIITLGGKMVALHIHRLAYNKPFSNSTKSALHKTGEDIIQTIHL
jgi:signal transduction histidine kinase